MSNRRNILIWLLLLITAAGWGFVVFRLTLASGLISGPLATTWRGLERRHAWAHWVSTNGTPTIRKGKAEIRSGQQFEFAVQPQATCRYLNISVSTTGSYRIRSRDKELFQPTGRGFLTSELPRTFDGYHFLLLADEDQTTSALTFTCRP